MEIPHSQRPDWRRPPDYDFTQKLNGGQWAWEFLRRHPQYREEWSSFMAVWRSLESKFGRPPDRDFCAWQKDPRAWVRVTEETAGECRVDQDKVLIECAFGARWGFHKFPPDPDDDDPVGGFRLTWRPVEQRLAPLGPDAGAWLGSEPGRVALGFDLTMPLAVQVDRAKRLLQQLQYTRAKTGQIRRMTVPNYASRWRELLRLLDAEACGADEEAIGTEFGDTGIAALRLEAREMLDHGYRIVAHL